MSAGSKRAASGMLLAAAVFVAGCDTSQSKADKQVRSDLAEARYLAQTQETPDAAKAKLAQASGNGEASPAVKTQALSAQAQSEMETAFMLMQKIDHAELELSRVSWGIIE